jgi:hypothetical protein
MSGRVYNWIANGALVLGIASAFLYDSTKVPHSLVVAAGVVAGVTAVALYFWNQLQCKKKETEVKNAAAEVPVVHVPAKVEAKKPSVDAIPAAWTKALTQTATLELQKRILADVWRLQVTNDLVYCRVRGHGAASQRWMADYKTYHHLAGRQLRYAFPKEARLMTPEVELSPREAAACAIEIMLNLAIQDKLNEWEYVFDAKGLRVSMKGPYGSRPVSSQEELRFEGMEAFAE